MWMKEDKSPTSEMVRAARSLLRWEQKDLAEQTMLSLGSIKRLESVPGPLAAQARTVVAIEKAFADNGVTFSRRVDLDARTATVTVSHTFEFKLAEDLTPEERAEQELPDDVKRALGEALGKIFGKAYPLDREE